jgi:hypothetical protein
MDQPAMHSDGMSGAERNPAQDEKHSEGAPAKQQRPRDQSNTRHRPDPDRFYGAPSDATFARVGVCVGGDPFGAL